MGYYVHEVPGRMRVKIPELKKDHTRARRIENTLEDMNGVSRISVNTLTGSVVVTFDPLVTSSRAILSELSQEGHIDLARAISGGQHFDNTAKKIGAAVSKAVLGLALDRALQGSPLSILTVLI